MSGQRKTGKRLSDGRLWMLLGSTVLVLMSATAATYNWKEAASGSFTDPGCWAEGSVPGSLDTAQFNVEGTYAVTFDATVTNKSFNMKKGDVTFQLSGNTYRVMNNGEPRIGSQAGDIAALTVTGGVFHVTPQYYLYLASDTSTGTLNVVGSDTTCILDPPNYGFRCCSNATLNVTGGATLRDSRFYFSLGRFYITNSGLMSNCPTFYPGLNKTYGGDARVWVTNGGSIYAGGDFWSGGGGNTWLTLSGSNSSIRASNSYIGNGSPYTELLVTDGAWFNGGSTINVNHSGGAAKTVNCILSGDNSQFGRSNGVCNVTVKGGGHLVVGKGCETRVRLFNVNSGGRVTLDGVLRHNDAGSNIITLDAGAQVQGSGSIVIHPSQSGYFRSSAMIHPGTPVGTLSLTGRLDEVFLDYSGKLAGNLQIEIGGREPGEYDRLSVFRSGTTVKPFTFGGTCEVVCVNGFLPKWGDVFKIVEWTKLTPANAFHAVNLPPLRWPCEWVTNDLYTTGEILVGGPEPVKGSQIMIR